MLFFRACRGSTTTESDENNTEAEGTHETTETSETSTWSDNWSVKQLHSIIGSPINRVQYVYQI